jgi:glycosyltransferase involved in cell wall biosynthesis
VRVLIAHSRYRGAGGEERSVELLLEALAERGIDVRLFQPSSADLKTRAQHVAAGFGMIYRPSAARKVRSRTSGWHPDVLHVHNLLPMLSPSVLREGARLGAAVILTTHNYRLVCPAGTLTRHGKTHVDCVRGSSFVCGARGARPTLAESLIYGVAIEIHRRMRLVDRWVDCYVAPCGYVRDVLSMSGAIRSPAERISVIPYGVHLPAKASGSRRYGLFAGRLSTEKGIETLLAAAARTPDVPFIVAGEGPLSGAVEYCGLSNVTFVGHLTPTSLAAVRSQAAFAVLPSEWPDVQPYAALESLAAGVPIVATRVGGLAELARDSDSRLTEPGDVAALAASMQSAWRAAQTEPAWGRDARRVAAETFSLKKHAAALVELYESAIRR